MDNTRPFTLALALGFAALIVWNWDVMLQIQAIRMLDAGSWASFCF